MKGLRAEGFSVAVATPCGESGIVLTPSDSVAASPLCAGFACIQIDLPVPLEECAEGQSSYLVKTLSDQVISATCRGTTLSVIMR